MVFLLALRRLGHLTLTSRLSSRAAQCISPGSPRFGQRNLSQDTKMASSTGISDFDQAKLDLAQVPACHIDGPGLIFKYILVKVTRKVPSLPANEALSKTVVRGFLECNYHGDILDMLINTLSEISKEFEAECLGGGRISHEHKKIRVYGYSQGYGMADHDVAVELLKQDFPGYEITASNEGY